MSEAGTALHTAGHTQCSLIFTICASCRGYVHWPLEVNLSVPEVLLFSRTRTLLQRIITFFSKRGMTILGRGYRLKLISKYVVFVTDFLSSQHTSWIYQKQGRNWKTEALQLKELCQRFVWGTQATFKLAVQAIRYLRAIRGPHLVTLMGNKELNTKADVASPRFIGRIWSSRSTRNSTFTTFLFGLHFVSMCRSYDSWPRARRPCNIILCNVCLVQRKRGDVSSSKLANGFCGRVKLRHSHKRWRSSITYWAWRWNRINEFPHKWLVICSTHT
jgi:hypothetical protein